ncbi:MAG TPA: diguanylate cyclase [Vicinamibacteria bacterium]
MSRFLDVRIRWRAGQVMLALAGVLALVALLRPLAPGAGPWVRFLVTLLLSLGVVGSALLASLKGRGAGEVLSLYAFLVLAVDGLGQMIGPFGWPVWPLLVLLVAAVAVAEPAAVALGVAALAAALAVAESSAGGFARWQEAAAACLGYPALVLAVHGALAHEKRRLADLQGKLARYEHDIDSFQETGTGPERLTPLDLTLRQVSEEGRRAKQLDRAMELRAELQELVALARACLGAHSAAYFAIDLGRERAFLQAGDGPPALVADAAVPLTSDPFAFVLDRQQSFYATDYKPLLWSLPYYRGEVKVGTLLAMPVRTGDALAGLLVADRLEIQAFTGAEPALVEGFARLAGEAILRARASLSREELGTEFRAAYEASQRMTALDKRLNVRAHLLRYVENLCPFEAAALVMTDDDHTRYTVEEARGWAQSFEGREVGLSERTWAAWFIGSAQEPYLLDDVAGHREHMPIVVLDEGGSRAESLLAVPLRVEGRNLGALVLTGPRGAFDSTVSRVLGILCNQAAAALRAVHLRELEKEKAVRDGLTGLYNRREFNRLLRASVSRSDRQGGRFGLVLLDIDHFKKLNDTFGHPAGDAVLRKAAEVLKRALRGGDDAARYGGEEFALILSGADEAGARHMAERVRASLEAAETVAEGARLKVTASLGVAVWPGDGESDESLLAAADRALYAAKQGGRNRVMAASALASPAAPAAE